jgi:hypothetical protein
MKNFIIGTLIGLIGGYFYGAYSGAKAQEERDCDLMDAYTEGIDLAREMLEGMDDSDQTETKEEISNDQTC